MDPFTLGTLLVAAVLADAFTGGWVHRTMIDAVRPAIDAVRPAGRGRGPRPSLRAPSVPPLTRARPTAAPAARGGVARPAPPKANGSGRATTIVDTTPASAPSARPWLGGRDVQRTTTRTRTGTRTWVWQWDWTRPPTVPPVGRPTRPGDGGPHLGTPPGGRPGNPHPTVPHPTPPTTGRPPVGGLPHGGAPPTEPPKPRTPLTVVPPTTEEPMPPVDLTPTTTTSTEDVPAHIEAGNRLAGDIESLVEQFGPGIAEAVRQHITSAEAIPGFPPSLQGAWEDDCASLVDQAFALLRRAAEGARAAAGREEAELRELVEAASAGPSDARDLTVGSLTRS